MAPPAPSASLRGAMAHYMSLPRTLVPRHENGDAHLDDMVDLKQTWKAVGGSLNKPPKDATAPLKCWKVASGETL